MVENLLMFSGVVAVYMTVLWLIRNDDAKSIDDQVGPFKIRSPNETGKTREAKETAGWRRRSGRRVVRAGRSAGKSER